jgi:hypothetical protein
MKNLLGISTILLGSLVCFQIVMGYYYRGIEKSNLASNSKSYYNRGVD